ncbi:hypothetical protein LMG28727_07225 [Paraburkholderia kirstenboschensis]|nr:hypothetical protein LMG28727_07225 [Paraburkholderia kirstenboschensis]
MCARGPKSPTLSLVSRQQVQNLESRADHSLLAAWYKPCYQGAAQRGTIYNEIPRVTDMSPRAPVIPYHPESIWRARRAFFDEGCARPEQIGDALIRSWMRCGTFGRNVHENVEFTPVHHIEVTRLLERHRVLVNAAQPELASLARSVSEAGYAVLLTDAHGASLVVDGAINSHGAQLRHAFRVGVDLSEQAVGTSAMSVAMSEGRPTSICGAEHYFAKPMFSIAVRHLFSTLRAMLSVRWMSATICRTCFRARYGSLSVAHIESSGACFCACPPAYVLKLTWMRVKRRRGYRRPRLGWHSGRMANYWRRAAAHNGFSDCHSSSLVLISRPCSASASMDGGAGGTAPRQAHRS